MSAADILVDAAGLIVTRGWTQYEFESTAGELCMVGAVNMADHGSAYGANKRTPDGRVAFRLLTDAVKPLGFFLPAGCNDAEGQTVGPVLDVLDAAATAAKEAGL